jgi:hypothetical protein
MEKQRPMHHFLIPETIVSFSEKKHSLRRDERDIRGVFLLY